MKLSTSFFQSFATILLVAGAIILVDYPQHLSLQIEVQHHGYFKTFYIVFQLSVFYLLFVILLDKTRVFSAFINQCNNTYKHLQHFG